jgi:hypothetical protein
MKLRITALLAGLLLLAAAPLHAQSSPPQPYPSNYSLQSTDVMGQAFRPSPQYAGQFDPMGSFSIGQIVQAGLVGATIPAPTATAYAILGNKTASSANATSLQQLILGTPAAGNPLQSTGLLGRITSSASGVNQFEIQGTDSGAASSTGFVVSNDAGTNSANYGEFGINSSTYAIGGSATYPYGAGEVYFLSNGGDIAVGTLGAKVVHLFANSVDFLTGSGAGAIAFPLLTSNGSLVTTGGAGAVSVSTSLTSYTLTTPVIASGLTASGSGANDFSASTGTFLTSTGANTLSGATTIADATTPSLTTAASKTNTGFLQVNGKTSGSLKITTADATAQAIILTVAAQTVGGATITMPNTAGASDTLAYVTLAQTLASKTLTSPVISTGLTASGSTANDFSGSSGTFLTSTGANTLSGATTINDATTPSLTTAASKTNTGFVQINGKTSGSLKITTADATAQAVILTVAAQTTGGATITMPNTAGVSDTLVYVTLSQTLAGKTLTTPVIATGLTATGAGTVDFSGSSAAFKTSTGAVTIGTGAATFSGNAIFNGTASTATVAIAPVARTSVWAPYLKVTAAADTGMTASTAFPGIQLLTASRQWAAGTVATQGEVELDAPTYTGSGATATFTQAATLYINNAPIVGANAAITTPYGILIGGTAGIGIGAAPSANLGTGMVQHLYSGFATAGQTPAATTRTVITGSHFHFSAGQLQVGTTLHWRFDMTKTGAGAASSTFDIAFGTAGTTGDTAQVSFTKPAGVANADEAWVDVDAVVKTNSASGVVLGEFVLYDNQTGAGGHLASGKYIYAQSVTSGTFTTLTPTDCELCITSGASDAITINQCECWATNL